jgi:hypothetical protein
MASEIDTRQLVTWFTDCMVAISFTQASGTTTNNAQMVTSQASQNSADTGLTAQEKAIATAISSGFTAAASFPSSSIHGGTIG